MIGTQMPSLRPLSKLRLSRIADGTAGFVATGLPRAASVGASAAARRPISSSDRPGRISEAEGKAEQDRQRQADEKQPSRQEPVAADPVGVGIGGVREQHQREGDLGEEAQVADRRIERQCAKRHRAKQQADQDEENPPADPRPVHPPGEKRVGEGDQRQHRDVQVHGQLRFERDGGLFATTDKHLPLLTTLELGKVLTQRLRPPPPPPRPPPPRPALDRPRLPDADGRERDGCWNALERLGARDVVGDWLVFGREIAGADPVADRDLARSRPPDSAGGEAPRGEGIRLAGAAPVDLRVSIFWRATSRLAELEIDVRLPWLFAGSPARRGRRARSEDVHFRRC